MPDTSPLPALALVLEEALSICRVSPTQCQVKGAQDYVTDLDLRLDAFFEERLPGLIDAPVLSEERVETAPPRLDRYWMVDPLDGTSNVVAGLPIFAVSVALIDAQGPCVAGIASGLDGTIWTARRGEAALRNGVPWTLPETPPAGDLIVLSTGTLDRLADSAPHRFAAFRKLGKIRNLGSQALHLCGVAAGQFGAVISREARIWDEAAGGLILREAGGKWASSADRADWTRPAEIMRVEQKSIAAHPLVFDEARALVTSLYE